MTRNSRISYLSFTFTEEAMRTAFTFLRGFRSIGRHTQQPAFYSSWPKWGCSGTAVINLDHKLMKMMNTQGPAVIEKVRPFTVFVEGNIASGKTTFVDHFSNFDDVHAIAEPVKLWQNLKGHNLLGLMYSDPARWSFTLQSYVQLTMVDRHVQETHKPVKLMERSIHSARFCFVENLHQANIMPSSEYAVLDEWYRWLTSHMDVSGDLIVYLRTDPEIAYERIQARARQEENQIPIDYLHSLHLLHEEWLYHRTRFHCPAQVLVIDANQSLSKMQEELKRLEPQILNRKLESAAGME